MLKKAIARGNITSVACVYERSEHKIDNSLVDPDALSIIGKIRSLKQEAFLVGGAVRDLALGKKPKDFDIVTSMTPSQLKAHFRNVRIIGNRFKLAHFHFRGGKIIEVATFRALESANNVNIYGTIGEDVMRRDFTVNALYYEPHSMKIYDFLGGYPDLLERKRLVQIMDLDRVFKEDPVRIIRGVKYSVKDGLAIGDELFARMAKDAELVARVSASRLFEELVKILQSGQSLEIMKGLCAVGVLGCILPRISHDIKIGNPVLTANLKFFDTIIANFQFPRSKVVELGAYSLIAHVYNRINFSGKEEEEGVRRELFSALKSIFHCFNIPNRGIENIVALLMNRTSFLLGNDENVKGFDA